MNPTNSAPLTPSLLRSVPSRLLLPVAGLVLCCACAAAAPREGVDPADGAESSPTAVDRLERMLTGRFDSSAQAAEDDAYRAVQLHTCAVDIPEIGDHVLYVEQALMSSLSAPYRQRLYVLSSDSDTTATSAVWEADDSHALVGLCDASDEERAARAPHYDAVLPLVGCEVNLEWLEDAFVGGTPERSCLTDYNGATYMMSEATITETEVRSWDRGYDGDGQQVWGAVDGPYVFVRQP